MTYLKHSTILAVLLLALATGCDSNNSADPETDAGGDATERSSTPDTQHKSAPDVSNDTTGSPQSDAGDRPTATASESGTIAADSPPELENLLPVNFIREFAAQKSESEDEYVRAPLPGTPPSPGYNAMRVHPKNGNDYGVGVQLWEFDDDDIAQTRFESLRKQYLNVQPDHKVAQEFEHPAFWASRGEIQHLVVRAAATDETDKPSVIGVSCSTRVCGEPGRLLKLTKFVLQQHRL